MAIVGRESQKHNNMETEDAQNIQNESVKHVDVATTFGGQIEHAAASYFTYITRPKEFSQAHPDLAKHREGILNAALKTFSVERTATMRMYSDYLGDLGVSMAVDAVKINTEGRFYKVNND